MQAFKRNLLQHHLAVGHWMRAHHARGGIDPMTLALEIECGGKRVRFFPQFVVQGEGDQLVYVAQMGSGVSGFVGWLPYFNKRWEHAADKLSFKAFAAASGLATPAWGGTSTAPVGSFLVKRRQSTFGQGMRGPFAAGTPVTLAEGEYWESFVRGRLVKAWFWDGELAVAEVVQMPALAGDGVRTVTQLAERSLGPGVLQMLVPPELLAAQGVGPLSVPAAGQAVQAEYRYISALSPANMVDHNVREQIRGTALEQSLIAAGRACWAAIPQGLRASTAFTLDAVLDAQDRLWLLEVNCNPQVHPAFYEWVLDALFEPVLQAA